MKKLKVIIISLICLLFGSCLIYMPVVFALEDTSQPTEVNDLNYYYNFGLDKAAFECLLTIKNCVTEETNSRSFSVNFFAQDYLNYTPSTEQGQSVVNDLNSGILYLVIGDNARYDVLKNLAPIKAISGFNYINFANINTLVLDYNEIAVIEQVDLDGFTNLSSLQVNNNNLSSIKISNLIKSNLENVVLRNNLLSEIDLSNLKMGARVDLFNNLLEELDKLILPNNLSYCDLSFNNLIGLTDISTLTTQIGCTPILLVQGVNKNLALMSKILIVNDGYVTNLKAICSYRQRGENPSNYSGEICSTSTENNVEYLTIPAGKIVINFAYLSASTTIPSGNLLRLQEEIELDISLPNPNFVCKVGDKEVDSYTQNDKMSFCLSYQSVPNLPNVETVNSDAKICYMINGATTEGNELILSDQGTYSLNFYTQFDGLQSSGVGISAKINNPLSIVLILVIIFGLFVVASVGFFLYRWFSDGAKVAPLNDKEIYRLNRRNRARHSEERYSYSFDNPQEKSEIFRKSQSDFIDLSNENVSQGEEQQDEENYYEDYYEEYDDYNLDNEGQYNEDNIENNNQYDDN